MMAYELSKTLTYKPKTVTTPLGTIDIPMIKDEVLLATVLRAGLPFHEGFLRVFDHAENGFVSAFRMYTNREHTEVGIHTEYMASPSVKGKTLIIVDPMLATGGSTEYMASPSVKGKTLIIVDPMLATGGSMVAAYEALLKTGKPHQVHIASVIGTPEGVEMLQKSVSDDVTLWCAAIDPGMNEHKYIVPGFGDCGDLCFGEKL